MAESLPQSSKPRAARILYAPSEDVPFMPPPLAQAGSSRRQLLPTKLQRRWHARRHAGVDAAGQTGADRAPSVAASASAADRSAQANGRGRNRPAGASHGVAGHPGPGGRPGPRYPAKAGGGLESRQKSGGSGASTGPGPGPAAPSQPPAANRKGPAGGRGLEQGATRQAAADGGGGARWDGSAALRLRVLAAPASGAALGSSPPISRACAGLGVGPERCDSQPRTDG